jgi:endo-1,4-beta-xylanase
MAQMTEELNARWLSDPRNTDPERLLIEGLGMQAHYWTADLSPVQVELTIQRFAQTGARVSITELDIPMGRWGAYEDATEENLQKQAGLYREVFDVLMRYSGDIERVTFWGKADPQSWRREGSPLLFDANFEAKDSFHQIVALAQGNTGGLSSVDEDPPDADGPELDLPYADDSGGEGDSSVPFLVIVAIIFGAVLLLGGIILLNKKK